MSTSVLIRTTFSDRLLPLALPRRSRRSRWSGGAAQQVPSRQWARSTRGPSESLRGGSPSAQPPLLARGSIGEQFIRRLGVDFFSATASSLFGDTPEAWARKAEQDMPAEAR